ncbi:tyramine/octopamine receptor-like [Pectinophora gossypiella]|uniref:tyramine/octopamine receptor-like n=1 Tax=Pectinophora gossypiella TaxID=13191 RepID=UPI00214E3E42|nr:tyramine/octopamine receptor-like [Pectinophora gossypiella]
MCMANVNAATNWGGSNTNSAMSVRGDVTVGWVAMLVAMSLVTICTIVGNALMLAAVRRAKRAPAHYALTSLLTADLLVGVCVLPLAAARELFVFHLPWVLCALWSTLDVLCCTASILSLCALGWERWWGITAPLAASRRAKRVRVLVAILWPLSVIIALPTGFIPSQKHYLAGEVPKACEVNTNIVYVFSSISFSFYIPTSVMVFFYAMILRSLASSPPLRAHRGRSPCVHAAQKAGNSPKLKDKCLTPIPEGKPVQKCVFLTPKRLHLGLPTPMVPSPLQASSPLKTLGTLSSMVPRQRRATQTIVMLMSLILVCWTPFFIMLPIDSLCDCVLDSTWQWCSWLGYANSALNPLVYAAGSPSVRRALSASLPLTHSRSVD